MATPLETLEHLAKTGIDENGIFPTPAISMNKAGEYSVYANACSPSEILNFSMSISSQPDVIEQIVAIDTYTKEGQGTTMDSCLILFHNRKGQPTRVGVLEYSWNKGNPITKPINWENEFWNEKYKGLAELFSRKIAKAKDVVP